MKFLSGFAVIMLLLAACQPNQPTEVLPTQAVLPTAAIHTPEATEPPTVEATQDVTAEATVEATAEVTEPAADVTAEATAEPTLTATVAPTLEPTQAASAAASEVLLEAPRYATFTPAPLGTLPPASSFHRVADVTITEQQFQDAVDLALASKPSIESAVVDFVPGAIVVKMTTNTTPAFSGSVTIPVTLQNDLASITISDIITDPMPPDQQYIDVATGDLFVLMVNTLDQIVTARIGPEQKLKSIGVTDNTIDVDMLVP